MKTVTSALIALAMILPARDAAASDAFFDIGTRPGITVGLMVTEPRGDPVAATILLVGGNGKLGLWRGRGTRSQNFLVRARGLFADRGVLAVTVDVPSDRRRDGLSGFRDSDDHIADLAAVLRWVRSRTMAPVWLIGTSRGTVSVAHAAGRLTVDGVVLSATVTEISRRNPVTALDGELEKIRVPALIVHHRYDGCHVTPRYGLAGLARRLTGAPKVETLLFDGGSPPQSEPCEARSAHGFFGIEATVVDAIVDWMRANGRP